MNINEIISLYTSAKEAKKAAQRQEESMKALILDAIGNSDSLLTDAYNVIVKKQTTTRLDTAALYKDFPDIKKDYGKTSTSTELIISEATQTKVKTA